MSVVRLEDHCPAPRRILMVEVARIACRLYGIPLEALYGHRRRATVVKVRRRVWLLCHEHLGKTWAEIGRHFDRDHSTVLVGAREIKELIASDPEEARKFRLLTERVFGPEVWRLAS